MDERLRALNRFGLGARIGEAAALGDPRAWLRAQLDGPPPGLEDDVPSDDEIWAGIGAFREAQQRGDQEAAQAAGRRLRDLMRREARAVLDLRLTTERPFVERLVAFWSNHLCVSVAGKPLVAPLAGHYERTVVRPHVLGRFEDMVLASASHPAMLVYLDNFRSVGPESPAARFVRRRTDREVGLNENYGRELLELHTLGVDGGYTQDDVIELARLLTGWTVAGLRGPGDPRPRGRTEGAGGRGGRARGGRPALRQPDEPGFVFQPLLHQPGDKRVLGERYGEGEKEGRRAIRDLCRHPSTARFVARKLARHFVADDPPAGAVDVLGATFSETEGDLRAVAERLIALDDAWDPSRRKFRTPQDWLVALFRAVRAPGAPEPAMGLLQQLRHPLWAPAAPKGYGDLEREWADPDSLMNRAELARSAARRAPRLGLEPSRLLEVVDVSEGDPLVLLLADESIDARERLALGFAGPAFQWR